MTAVVVALSPFSARSTGHIPVQRAKNAGLAAPDAPDAPDALTVDGTTATVGVDPGDVEFAWHVVDGRRGARQHAYRILVATAATTDPASTAIVWDSGPVTSSRQAFVAYGGPPLAADTDYWWTVATADPSGTGATFGPFARPAHFVTGLTTTGPGIGSWRPSGCVRGRRRRRGRSTRTCARQRSWARARSSVRPPTSPPRTSTSCGSTARAPTPGRRSRIPTSSTSRPTDVTRFVKAGATNVIGVLHHWYGAGQGRPASAPGLLVQVSVLHRRRDARRDRDGRHVAPAPGRVAARAAAQRGGRPRRARRRPGLAARLVDRRLRRLGVDAGRRCSARSGPRPFTGLVVQRTRIVEHAAPAGLGPPAGGRRGRRRPRRGRGRDADRRLPPRARRAARSSCTSASCSIATGTSRRPGARRAPT